MTDGALINLLKKEMAIKQFSSYMTKYIYWTQSG